MAEGTQLPPQLLRYWSTGGKGGAEINWGVSGRSETSTGASLPFKRK
jgi:hypothetical protein